MLKPKKKFWLKSKSNLLALATTGSGILALVINDEIKGAICKVLCDSPKSAAGMVVSMGLMQLFARNFKSNTKLKTGAK